jgi:hypothetical protein
MVPKLNKLTRDGLGHGYRVVGYRISRHESRP